MGDELDRTAFDRRAIRWTQVPGSSEISVWLFAAVILVSCDRRVAKNASGEPIYAASLEEGRRLAVSYCQSCHQLPDPALLDKRTWENGVLPNMGPRVGIFNFKGKKYGSLAGDPNVGRSFYPSLPLMSQDDWQALIDYYSGSAPDSLKPTDKLAPISMSEIPFRAVEPKAGMVPPATCMVQIDSQAKKRTLVVGQLGQGSILRFDAELNRIDSVRVYGAAVCWKHRDGSAIVCNMGNINPNDGHSGSIWEAHVKNSGEMSLDPTPFIRDLARPVWAEPCELSGDTMQDYLVCEFGNLKGALSWMENKGDGKFDRHILRAKPGAIKAYVQDANGDGLPDIWALFAQGDEGIFLYINKGKGRFEEQQVLQFPPVYGSSGFELDDFNGDGYPDILYTCGDNADYSPILKPYHGVYVFLNDGHNHFTQRFFCPINGCYKAIARDFDGDGDLDIATISFFADYAHRPEEGFVYLENKGNWNFRLSSVPAALKGRWLTMDAGDLNGDGKPDLVLGNFSVAPAMLKGKTNWKKGPAFLLLQNIHP